MCWHQLAALAIDELSAIERAQLATVLLMSAQSENAGCEAVVFGAELLAENKAALPRDLAELN